MEMEAVIFDVDGTIWDSAKEVAESWTEAFQNYPESKGRVLTAADLEPYMGLTMEAIGEGLLPGLEKERREEIMCYAMEYENIYLAKHPGRFFPDFVSTVKSLEKTGKKLFIVSNCQSGYIEAMLTAAGLAFGEGQLIRDIECFGNTGKSKAENIRLVMERNGLSREKTVYLGDTALDRASLALRNFRKRWNGLQRGDRARFLLPKICKKVHFVLGYDFAERYKEVFLWGHIRYYNGLLFLCSIVCSDGALNRLTVPSSRGTCKTEDFAMDHGFRFTA